MMLSFDTAYRSFGGEVEASSTPTICRLSDSRRHQLSAIAPFYADLEDYVRQLQSLGAKVFLIRGVPSSKRFNPTEMVTRGVTGFRIDPDFDKPEPIAGMRAIHTLVDAKLRAIAERTGATLLDLFADVCGSGEDCSPLFGAGEPKFTDGMHLRPVFVREHLHFLDFLLI
jgi:hypothetical protein